LFPSTVFNFAPGTNPATVNVISNLVQGGTLNIAAGAGFTNGIYTLFTYGKNLSGSLPTLGSTPAGYNYSLFDSSAGLEVNLVVTLLPPTNLVATATNLQINLRWNSVNGASTYNLKRGTVNGTYPTVFSGLTATNYADAAVTNAVTYYYLVSAVGAGGESTNSPSVSAVPLPSNQPTNLTSLVAGNQLQLSWLAAANPDE
jgi:hypothetical protein